MPMRVLPSFRTRRGRAACLGPIALAIGLTAIAPADAAPAAAPGIALAHPLGTADFRGEAASAEARFVANWVVASHDNQALPFLVIDKANARVFVFDASGTVLGAAAALLGLGRGDDSVPDIGHRRLATITPAERTTPAGRFKAALGNDFEQDILWIDYDKALSLHRVIVGNRKDRRAERLASPSTLDNRISYGCVNVPVRFYDDIVAPAFTGTVGIVYILPESKPLRAVFAIPEQPADSGGAH
jgi:hypothetical protein